MWTDLRSVKLSDYILVRWHSSTHYFNSNHHNSNITELNFIFRHEELQKCNQSETIFSLLICNLICCAVAFPGCLCIFSVVVSAHLSATECSRDSFLMDGWLLMPLGDGQKSTNIWKCFLQWGQSTEGSHAASRRLEKNGGAFTRTHAYIDSKTRKL